MQCCNSSASGGSSRKRAANRSRRIDEELSALARRYKATQRIVLLGSGESGKSTFIKQMQIIHGNGFSDADKRAYRTQIYENMMRGMAGLVNAKRELRLQWRGTVYAASLRELSEASETHTARMRAVVAKFTGAYKSLMMERERQQVALGKPIDIEPEQFSDGELCQVLAELWQEHAIREAFDRRREFSKYFLENMPYFMANLDRIGSIDYVPDNADIVRCRRATTLITEIEIEINRVPFRFVDVGGQRTQRQKWHSCFSDVTAILFMASCSDYDECLREDGQTNRLVESINIFDTLVNYKYLSGVEFILFLNKYDLLCDKLHRANFAHYMSDFRGNPRLLADVKLYLVNKFSSMRHPKPAYNNNNNNSNDDGDSIQNEVDSNNNHNGNKAVYTHFTTAIDTNNIRTIFEIVRLMIFEKNCQAIMLN